LAGPPMRRGTLPITPTDPLSITTADLNV
jgi:hypothetical protein